LKGVAALHQAAPRLEDVVGVEVDVPLHRVDVPGASAGGGEAAGPAAELIAPGAVLLHAERVGAEQEGQAPVVVGVEQDLDVVLAADVVAVGPGGADHVAVDLAGPDPEPDGVGCVPDADLGGLLGRPAVHRLILREAGQDRRLGPDVLVQPAVGNGPGVDSGDRHADVAGAAAVVGQRIGALGEDRKGQKRCQVHGGGNLSPAGPPAHGGAIHRRRWE